MAWGGGFETISEVHFRRILKGSMIMKSDKDYILDEWKINYTKIPPSFEEFCRDKSISIKNTLGKDLYQDLYYISLLNQRTPF